MRTIKFRAWNVIRKTMIDLKKITPLALNMDTDGLFIPFSDGLPLMQFTGLYDKNGKEIWESDIVRLFGSVRKVVSAHGAYGYMGDFTHHFISFVQNSNFRWNGESILDIEIIGNIYENPELLKEPK